MQAREEIVDRNSRGERCALHRRKRRTVNRKTAEQRPEDQRSADRMGDAQHKRKPLLPRWEWGLSQSRQAARASPTGGVQL